MDLLYSRNVEDAYADGVATLHAVGEKQSSRAGDVLVAPHPVMTVYDYPQERVLFDEGRDANPFFHLFESLWMLAGRNDARWLDRFVSDFSKRFAEEDGLQHGAYGFRWKRHFGGINQLETIVSKLKNNPQDRRVVLQMWDPESDLLFDTKDIPCNTTIFLRIVHNRLDLTVMCRSNDIVWGAYGANAVHFSVLQEYLAGRLGIKMGRMYQLSNNWHGYLGVLEKVGDPSYTRYYESQHVFPVPMGEDWLHWDEDLAAFMRWSEDPDSVPDWVFYNQWFDDVAVPMLLAHHAWKTESKEASLEILEKMEQCDWQVAAQLWIERRKK